MLINADFSARALVTPGQYEWVASPQAGVERVMLDRIGEEKARATSIVRYAARSRFPGHHHPGGEEILVLSGTFSEDNSHYPAGWYLRSPPGSSHVPFSDEGAVIFVKLRQMDPGEKQSVRIDTHDPANWITLKDRESCPLFASETEKVSMERLPARTHVFSGEVDGAEILILEGSLQEGSQIYEQGSWVRLPPGSYPDLITGHANTMFYLKTGHLSI